MVLPNFSEIKWVEVGKVKEIYIYPLKSGRPVKLDQCDFTELGPSAAHQKGHFTLRDRGFLVYDEKNYRYLTARQHPGLLLITLSSVDEKSVKLTAPKMPDIVIRLPKFSDTSKHTEIVISNGEKVACMDCGTEAAEWVSRMHYLKGTGLAVALNAIPTWGLFSDVFSYMIMFESTVNGLNKRLNKPVPTIQFRHNILVSGTEIHAEDNFDWIKIGESAIIRKFKNFTRCKMIRIDPESAESDPIEPYRTLQSYRQITDKDEISVAGNAPLWKFTVAFTPQAE